VSHARPHQDVMGPSKHKITGAVAVGRGTQNPRVLHEIIGYEEIDCRNPAGKRVRVGTHSRGRERDCRFFQQRQILRLFYGSFAVDNRFAKNV